VGVKNIGIAVGYEKDQIIQHVMKNYRDHHKHFCFIENPAFATTNNIYSFWLAQKWLNGESFVCLNADVVCDALILAPAVEPVAPITMIVDPRWRDETMKVIVSGNRVVQMSKLIPKDVFSGTYIGITSFSASVQEELFAKVNNLIETGNKDVFFNVAVQKLADEGVGSGLLLPGISLGPRSMIPATWLSRDFMFSPS
jgi:choline kinase